MSTNTNPTDLGRNRTGAAASPIDRKRLEEASERATPFAGGDGAALAAERLTWSAGAEPVGTMPPPMTLKGAAKTGLELLKGHKPTVFLDKLGERAAYERAGTRLYEALLVKLDAADPHPGGPTRSEVEQLRDDELAHYAVVRDAILKLGADPTAMTPCADVTGVLGQGLVQVLTDPRTTLTQCLDAMLVAELTDNDGWAMLVDLAQGLGHDELAEKFQLALDEEEEHLTLVRAWLTNAVHGQAGLADLP
jgi:hypothetical protein